MQQQQAMNWQGQLLRHYRLLRALGPSSSGESWLAEDTRVKRQVVVKLLHPVQATEQSFANHARRLAGLEHPNILPIYDSGEHTTADNEVVSYLVMPYVSSGSLQERLQQTSNPLQTRDILLYLRQAAQALDYAHSRQVIHGNLKPTNILLQQSIAQLTDFSPTQLQTDVAYEHRTYTVGIISTEYMAPEQGQGPAQAASDCYSLAVVAYQLFTKHLPFSGNTPDDILLKHMHEQPTPPQQLAELSAELSDALLEGLAKQPERRTSTCLAFVEALEQACHMPPPALTIQQAQITREIPVLFQEEEDAETVLDTRKWKSSQTLSRKHLVPFNPLKDEEGAEETILAPWKKSSSQSQTLSKKHLVPLGPFKEEVYTSNPHVSSENAQDALYISSSMLAEPTSPDSPPPSPDSPPQSSPAQSSHTDQAQDSSKISRRNLLIGGGLGAVALTAAGVAGFTILRPTPKPPVVASGPGPYNLRAGVPVVSLIGHNQAVWTAVWSPDGRYLATGGEDHSVMVWDIGGALQKKSTSVQVLSKPLRIWKYDTAIYNNHICWSPDGRKLLVSLLSESKLYLLDVFGDQNTKPAYVFDLNKLLDNNSFDRPQYAYIDWSRTNSIVATTSFAKDIWIWQGQNPMEPVKQITYIPPADNPQANRITPELIGWSSDGSKLATLTNNFAIVVWDAKTGQEILRADLPERTTEKSVYTTRDALAWSPTNPNLLMASDLDAGIILDIRKGKQPVLQLGINDPYPLTPPPDNGQSGFKWLPHITGAAWAPNGKYIAGAYGRSASIYVWETDPHATSTVERGLRMQKLIFGANGHDKAILDLAWSPRGQYIASASYDTTVIVWKVDGA